jgi:hypothetical protein
VTSAKDRDALLVRWSLRLSELIGVNFGCHPLLHPSVQLHGAKVLRPPHSIALARPEHEGPGGPAPDGGDISSLPKGEVDESLRQAKEGSK